MHGLHYICNVLTLLCIMIFYQQKILCNISMRFLVHVTVYQVYNLSVFMGKCRSPGRKEGRYEGT